MVFDNPSMNIKPVESSEQAVVVFGKGNENGEVLITNKRIYGKTNGEYVRSETIISLESVTFTNFRFYHKKHSHIPWIGLSMLLLAAIIFAFTYAMTPYFKNDELKDFLLPMLYVVSGAIVLFGILSIVKKLSKPASTANMPKGVINVYCRDTKQPFVILIFEKDEDKLRKAHYSIHHAIAMLNRAEKRST